MLLGAAAEGATPDVVPQLFDQFGVLLLDLLRKLLSAGEQRKEKQSSLLIDSFQSELRLDPPWGGTWRGCGGVGGNPLVFF